jgi:hypothetical protein
METFRMADNGSFLHIRDMLLFFFKINSPESGNVVQLNTR